MKTTLGIALLAASLLVLGCAHLRGDHMTDLAPHSLAYVWAANVAPGKNGRPVVALALGGGGLRGYAHIGVLRALEESGIRPDIIVGTSAGSLVGAAYASGMTTQQIEAAALDIQVAGLIDWTVSSSGLMRGAHLAGWISRLTNDQPMEHFPIRFAAIATDMESGEVRLIDSGRAAHAIQASTAVPGVTIPVPYSAGHLIDGGVASLVPVQAARAMGADIVIAVDIYCHGPRPQGLGAMQVLGRVAQTQNCLAAKPEMAAADLLIAPAVGVPGMSSKEDKIATIRAGYEAAQEALHQWRQGTVRLSG
jgi:NTE family protein